MQVLMGLPCGMRSANASGRLYRCWKKMNVAKAQSEFALMRRRLLCLLGRHGFDVVDVVMGFGTGGNAETVKCRYCGLTATRQG